MLLLLVSQQFHPLSSVEEDQKLADQLRRLYISKETKHERSVSCEIIFYAVCVILQFVAG